MATKITRIPATNKGTPNGHEKWQALQVQSLDGNNCNWGWANADELLEAVVAATEDGAALLLSKTSDGGALCVQVWSGSDRFKLYPASEEETSVVLRHILAIARGSK